MSDMKVGKITFSDDNDEEIFPGDNKRRLRQMSINFNFVFKAIEEIHRNICPGQNGSWQDRVKQAVEASIKLKGGE